MLDAAAKALVQMFSPPFRSVLWKALGLALLLMIVADAGRDKAPLSQEKATPPGHENTPPGQEKTPPGPAGPKERHDVPGSGHGKGFPQAPPNPVGAHHRGVGHLAPPAARPAPAPPHARPKARPEARQPRGEGGHGPPPPQVTHGNGNGHNEDGKG